MSKQKYMSFTPRRREIFEEVKQISCIYIYNLFVLHWIINNDYNNYNIHFLLQGFMSCKRKTEGAEGALIIKLLSV
jgi:hypothetical protein